MSERSPSAAKAVNARYRFYVARGRDAKPRVHIGHAYPPWVVVDRVTDHIVAEFSHPGRNARDAARRYVREHNAH